MKKGANSLRRILAEGFKHYRGVKLLYVPPLACATASYWFYQGGLQFEAQLSAILAIGTASLAVLNNLYKGESFLNQTRLDQCETESRTYTKKFQL